MTDIIAGQFSAMTGFDILIGTVGDEPSDPAKWIVRNRKQNNIVVDDSSWSASGTPTRGLYQMWCTTKLYTGTSSISSINDLAFACTQTFALLFANDSNLFSSGKDADYIQQMIKDELKDIVVWRSANKLSLNISKTHYMVFSN